MKCIKINLSIFLYITIVYCFGKFENYKENNISLINNNERIKRSISFQRYQDKLKNNDHYKKKRMFLSQLRNKVEISIPYYVEHNVNYQLVDLALQFIQQETCLKFVKQQKMIPTSLGLQYSFGSKCTSSTEKKTNKQWKKISIASDCSNIESIQRETMHSLGFIYTQNRFDRDKYLRLLTKSINHYYLSYFKKTSYFNSKTFGVSFDYGSVLMLKPYEYSNNARTMIPYDLNFYNTMGTEEKLTFNDVKLINIKFCQKICTNNIKCMNEGYQDPNDCKKCKCVKGFFGAWCQLLPPTSRECGETVIKAGNSITLLEMEGRHKCIYHIFSEKRKKIALYILSKGFFSSNKNLCYKRNSLEVKYWKDKAPTGARFCSLDKNTLVVTENNHGIIYFRSKYNLNRVKILLKSVEVYFNEHNIKNEFMKEKLTFNL